MHDKLINIHKRKLQSLVLTRAIRNLSRYQRDFNILCLPGIMCWELDFLLHQKCINPHIYALEHDEATYLKIKNYGSKKVTFLNQQTSNFIATTDVKFGLIYLDYFSNLGNTIRFDVEAIIERKLLIDGGKLALNMYGARETITDQHVNNRYYREACNIYKMPELNTNAELNRCRAFNAMIMLWRRKYRAKLTSPSWAKYRSENAYMYTAWLSCHGYLPLPKYSHRMGSDPTGAVSVNKDLWFLTGKRAHVKEIIAAGIMGVMAMLAKRGLTQAKDDHYKAKIKAFYDQYGYTPYVHEIGKPKGGIVGFNRLVRELGLCPRMYATTEEIIAECKRIELRHGYVTWSLLKKYKLNGRFHFTKGNRQTTFKRLLNRNHIKYITAYDVRKQSSDKEMMRRLHLWLDHLDTGKPRHHFKYYSYMNKFRLLKRDVAARKLYDLTKSLQSSDLPHQQS